MKYILLLMLPLSSFSQMELAWSERWTINGIEYKDKRLADSAMLLNVIHFKPIAQKFTYKPSGNYRFKEPIILYNEHTKMYAAIVGYMYRIPGGGQDSIPLYYQAARIGYIRNRYARDTSDVLFYSTPNIFQAFMFEDINVVKKRAKDAPEEYNKLKAAHLEKRRQEELIYDFKPVKE